MQLIAVTIPYETEIELSIETGGTVQKASYKCPFGSRLILRGENICQLLAFANFSSEKSNG